MKFRRNFDMFSETACGLLIFEKRISGCKARVVDITETVKTAESV